MTISTGSLLLADVHLPSLLQDETLYSWCARFYRLNLGLDPRATSRMLFGHSNAGLHHDIPFALSEFESRTQAHLGNAFELLAQQTIFGFHAKFLPCTVEQEVAQLFLGLANSLGRGKLGLKKAGHGDDSRLRLCPECVSAQRGQYDHTWWLLRHQLPTSLVCIEHLLPLWACQVEQYRGIARDFHLPSLEAHSTLGDSKPKEVMHCLVRIADWGIRIHGQDRLRLTDNVLRWCYRLKAKERGWGAFDGSLRMQQLRDAFVSHYGAALDHFDASLFGDLAGANGGFLAYLFRQSPSRRHPLKHVLLMNFLFEHFDSFEEAFREVQQILDSDGPAGCEKRLRDNQVELLRLVQGGGQSLSEAAPTIGISVTVAARFIDKHKEIKRDRRPHIIGTEKEVLLCTLLEQGIPRKELAEKAGVRRSFITDFLATRPALKAIWVDANRLWLRDRHRQQLTAALQEYPDLPIKTIRRLSGNGFQWLYNNDREWLQEVLPAIWKR